MISDKLRALIAKELGHDPELCAEVRWLWRMVITSCFWASNSDAHRAEMIGLKKIQAAYANEQLPRKAQPSS